MDVVITYVDITDRFREQYSKYVKKELEENRFRSYGVLDLQIKGIRKYMPYIKNIFVVVSEKEQVEGIDLSDAIIIEHKDIIPERYLPCFNSCTIEMFLWKIPGLDEEFIYFNDDIFVIDKIHPSKWFIKGKPVLFPKEHEIKEEENIFKKNCINSSRLAVDITGSDIKDKYFTQTHCARPFLKSSCEKVFNLKVLDIIYSLTRTRHSKNYNASLFNDYDYLSGKSFQIEVKYTYINTYNTAEEIINYINKKENSLICINDTDYYIDFDEFKLELRKIIEANIEGKKYIREVKKEENKKIVLDNTPLKVALCAIAKNENLYIREWVEWYKNLGISKIFLYDNNELDGERFEEVINDYIESGFVEVIDVRGVEKGCVYDKEGINLQPKCYIDCYENKVKDFDWICFFDIDEFLTFKNGYNLFGFLNQKIFNYTDTILVSWEHYDDNNLYDYDIRNVVERFPHKSKIGFHGVKSIVKTNKIIYEKTLENLIHCFRLIGDNVKFSNGNKVNLTNIHNWYSLSNTAHDKCNVVLNHYKTKTIVEYLLRHLGRHWGTGKKYTDNVKSIENCYNDFFLYNEKTEIKEEIINNFSVDKYGKNINYYKKLKQFNINSYVKKYKSYVNSLSLKDNLTSKKLKKEIGIISLTTWKARINNVYFTLCNLLDVCPNFHIVLVLSEEEFPNKENDLPIELKKLISNKLIEILWTPNNYKTCKKLIFTVEKYADKKIPIITADDDCLYITNYAQELYNRYKQFNNYVIRYNMYNVKSSWQYSQGPSTLYNPIIFKYFLNNKEKFLNTAMLYKDDQVITNICKENKIKFTYLYRGHIFPFVFINEFSATNNNTKNIDFINCYV